jgi:hypothetical protein
VRPFLLVVVASLGSISAHAADSYVISMMGVGRATRGLIVETTSTARKVDLRPGGGVFSCTASVKSRVSDGASAGATAHCRRRSVQGPSPKEGRTYVISDRAATSDAEDASFWRLDPNTGETTFCAHMGRGSTNERYFCIDAADSSAQ